MTDSQSTLRPYRPPSPNTVREPLFGYGCNVRPR